MRARVGGEEQRSVTSRATPQTSIDVGTTGSLRSPSVKRYVEPSILACALALTSCNEAVERDPGALIDMRMESTVGVLLDEIPASQRERVAAALLAQPSDAWQARAELQVETTYYRLTFRNLFYEGLGILPLPPRPQWVIEVGSPERRMIDGHDLVVVDYTFTGTLLAAVGEPAIADPALSEIGGTVEEVFTLPVDPELLLERTGYACMDEEDFPPNSVDTENARSFFDDTCEGGDSWCHITEAPAESCVEALRANVGAVETAMRFERRPWDTARADEVRYAEQVRGGPQLRAVQEGLEDNRIVYRYYGADSCAIAEGCVGGAGWRRLLQFTATMHNLGDEDAYIGDVGPGSPPVVNNMVSLSECHGHMHFNHYGNFAFGDGSTALGSKRAFCLESTTRYSNTELAPLTHPFTCEHQGTAAGWGDDYIAGLDCQWIDITPIDTSGGLQAPLTFQVNPDGFLCEGELQREANGDPRFEPTEFLNELGEPESRFACEQREGWAEDNMATTMVDVPPVGGLVTEPCRRELLGERRNCGFVEQGMAQACVPGEVTTLTCSLAEGDAPQALRLCETSAVLGHTIPCLYREALASVTLAEDPVEVSFTCPSPRDATEPGGEVGMFVAPVVGSDPVGTVTCM